MKLYVAGFLATILLFPGEAQPPVGAPQSEVLIFSGEVEVPAKAFYHVDFDTTSNFTRARLAGSVQALGGSGNDIRVLVAKDRTVVYNSGQRRTVVFSVDVSERAHYTLYLDNRFSLVSAKSVTGKVSLVAWNEDTERNSEEDAQAVARQTAVNLIIQALYSSLVIDEQALGTRQLSGVPRVYIVKNQALNAWTASGSIAVTSGLFNLAGGYGMEGAIKASDILGNVIAHELSHIFYQHPGYGSTGSGARGLLDELRGKTWLDRTQEREADILGIRVACQAGFNPDGMLEFIRVVARMESGASSFMKNHPSGVERLNYLEGEAKKCHEVQGH